MNYQNQGYPKSYQNPMKKPSPVPINPNFIPDYLQNPMNPVKPMPKVEPVPMAPMPKPKPMPKPLSTLEEKKTLNVFPVDEGFIKGTIFKGIYEPYKNYETYLAMPTTDEEKLLFDVDKFYFALHEMRMYLDNYPEDQEAIDLFTQYQQNYIRAKKSYEEKYGPLDIEAQDLNTSPWKWTTSKWPWVGGM